MKLWDVARYELLKIQKWIFKGRVKLDKQIPVQEEYLYILCTSAQSQQDRKESKAVISEYTFKAHT